MSDDILKPVGALSAPSLVSIDGRSADLVEVTDRGLHYGDGLFETVLIQDGRPCQWSRHRDRLHLGARNLGVPLRSPDDLGDQVLALAKGVEAGVLKILVTRGSGGRGYRPSADPCPRRVLLLYPLAEDFSRFREQGIRVRYCRTPSSLNPALAGMKHLNRLDSVLARREWDDPSIAEGLMLDPSGLLIGGTMTNLFLWDGGCLRTPPVDRAGIAGTRRGLALELAGAFGLRTRVEPIEPRELEAARGIFLTNAVAGVWPVHALDGLTYPPDGLPWDFLRELWRLGRRPG
ncbi:aminodeoxychorismate lyase [Imhoffiella purpurea]|uniref:Aminodeoxychorismate lyase n=1 Tax=Imhoffiella purpurea TaxID=1249627 RepID=W9VYB4_9GAMM|nr:aminodeoxychorismate lyase [Imhoffiella purpurea]EXJ15365.1 Aminodeoxychorismate lyase [Imhoffiella purpurea]